MDHWFLLQSKPKQELVAYQNLCNQGYTSFLPTIVRQKIQRGVLTTKTEPLFNRYLFVRLDPDGGQSWAPLRSTIGVAQLVRFGTRYAKLDDELINTLNAQSNRIEERYQAGDRVTITKGPFVGFEAVFASYDGNERAILFLQWLSERIRVRQASFALSTFSVAHA